MDEFDKQRIENAIWTLEQYRDDIVNMASDMKLEQYEVEAMFKTLGHVRGLTEK